MRPGGIASIAFTVFFVWVVVYALLFFSGPVATLQLCAVVVGYATAHVLLDIDHFKQVNDRYGHETGDRLLQMAAKRWATHLRAGDLLARQGGDEFLVVLPVCQPREARAVVDRLRSATPGEVTCSAGVATWRPGDSISMLVGRADRALYEAKRGGRNRMFMEVEDGTALRELARAIDSDQLVVHYQPITSLRSGLITGFEALVRWQHPDRGLLPPSEFIGLAEDSGLIVDLGAWVLTRACRQARAWADAFPDQRVAVAVNLAGRQLDDPGIVDTVQRALTDSGLSASRLTLEVTETMLAETLHRWVERLWELRRLGVQLAMDDFGTGYSSLNQVRRLPVDTIKIDRSFVDDLTDSPEAVAVVTAMLGIGKGLGRTMIAEGIETVEQLHELSRLGCHEAQGFLIGSPAPDAVATTLLHRQQRLRDIELAAHAEQPWRDGRAPDETGPGLAELLDGSGDFVQNVRPLLDHIVGTSELESAHLTRIRGDVLEQEVLFATSSGALHVSEGRTISWADSVCRQALEAGPVCTEGIPETVADHGAATGARLEFHASVPVVLHDGTLFGTLCVAGRNHIEIDDEFMALLSIYSRLISDRLAAVDRRQGQPDTASL